MTTSRHEQMTGNRSTTSNKVSRSRSKTPSSTSNKAYTSSPTSNMSTISATSSSSPTSPVKEITFSDLCLNDKTRLREMVLTIEKQMQEIQEADKRLKEEKRISADKLEKMKKQNEALINQSNTLKTKTNQNAIMLRTYQTKIEQLIEENVDMKKRFEEEKSKLQNELDDIHKTVTQLREQNSQLRGEIDVARDAVSKKPELVHQHVQTVSLQIVPQTVDESLRKTKTTEEALEREFQKYLSTHNLTSLSATKSKDEIVVEDSQLEEEQESSDVDDDDDKSDLTDEDIDLAFAKYITQSKLFSTSRKQIPNEKELEEESSESESEEEQSIFSEDSLFDVVQLLEEQQNYERLSVERQSIDTLSQFNLVDSKEQLTGPLWFKNEDES